MTAPEPIEIGADWTDEQIAEFREALEKATPGQVRLLPPGLGVAPYAPREFDYRVIITWPAAGSPGCMVTVHDADTGDQIYAITRLAVYATAGSVVTWALAEMLLGADGRPSAPAGSAQADVVAGEDGEPLTGVFSLLITEMRIAPRQWQYPVGGYEMPAGPSA